ncbi:hypothetical protein ACIRTB_31780 [Streptomyces sp. NPDC101158]|uniref:hypothetical protein n=1 Tax=Streptomyces sp. NPDC101158 TaxID=3366117 RepID=UPI0038151D0A
MWNRLALRLAVLLFALTPTLAAAPADTVAQRTCAAADGHRLAGSLDRAKKLYESVKAGDGDQRCAADGLRLVAKARQDAAELVTAGQLLIRSGDLEGAEDRFRRALRLDAAGTAAGAGIGRVLELRSRPLPTAVSNGDRFYRDWALPLGGLAVFAAVGMLVLFALSGLCSRWLVKVDAVAWTKWPRRIAKALGGFLLFAVAVMTPLFAMFNPFTPTWTQCWVGVLVLVVVGTGVAFLVFWGAAWKAFPHWRALLVSVGVVTVALGAVALLASDLSHDVRLMGVHVGLAVIGVLVTAAAFGQNLRLQVEVQESDGSVNAASSDYLLARMKSLGTEDPAALHKATSTPGNAPLSQIPVEELSVLPAGKVVGALSRLFFALRPDLTWRARVTLVDDNRVATALTRNGQHAASQVFSRPDLRLPAESDTDRAKAQLLTGAAAFILVQLSTVYHDLQDGLYGARHWRSVALQVIARSRSLLADDSTRTATRVRLLAKAVDEDQNNEMARFAYLWAEYEQRPYSETDFGAFARIIDQQYRASTVSGVTDEQEGWMPLKLSVLYSSATQWLNCYVEGDGTAEERAEMLGNAYESAAELDRLCDAQRVPWKGKELRRQQALMHPHARNLIHSHEALSPDSTSLGTEQEHSHDGPPAPPRLAYDHACLHMLVARRPDRTEQDRRRQRDYAIEDLARALVTEADRQDAKGDPCFAELRTDARFQKLVRAGLTPSADTPGKSVAGRAASAHKAFRTWRPKQVRRPAREP